VSVLGMLTVGTTPITAVAQRDIALVLVTP
jgi:hypothetical protein